MTVPITGNLTETQRFPAPSLDGVAWQAGPGRADSSGYPPVKSRWSGIRRGGDLSSERRCLPGCLRTSTSLTRTTGRPGKKCIEYSPHMEQQHGLLVVDKPRGLSSAQCTNRFKRLGQKKIGHAGTLDPMAQGVSVGASRARDQNLRISHGGEASKPIRALSGSGRPLIRGTPTARLSPKRRGTM